MFALLVLPSRATADEGSVGAERPAEKGAEAIHFEYEASPDCPSAESFLGKISAYTTRFTLAGPGPEARRFVVRIDQRDRGYVGHFNVRAASGETAGRDIEGESCDDAALGLAVAVALAIDPEASLVPPAPPPVDGPAASAAPAPSPPRDAPRSMPARAPSASSPPPRPAVSFGARAEANGAVSGVLAVIDLFVELEWPGASRRVPALRPAVRGGWRNAFTRTVQVGQARAEIDWTAGYLEACPARFAVARDLAIEACLGANLGILSAQAPDLPAASVTRRTWLDYGGLLGARWQPHTHLFVEAVASAWAPITRDRLRIEPDGLVTRAPSVGISAGIGGGWRF